MSVDVGKGMGLFKGLSDIVLYLVRSEPCGFEPVLGGLQRFGFPVVAPRWKAEVGRD